MDVDLFDFALPNELIALRPARPRPSARMLVVDKGSLQDKQFFDLPQFLRAGDILVFNDTKVIPARLIGKRGEAKIEVTLHKRVSETVWRVFAKPAKKCRLDDIIDFAGLKATVTDIGDAGERQIEFDVEPDQMMARLHEVGYMPLPPYIAAQRSVDAADSDDYQTVFASSEGAVAAPTAGLHFTGELLEILKDKGVESANVTLHVGAGTFLPVKAQDTADHKMHSEWGEISPQTAEKINAARKAGGRIVCVGTTSLRLLESAANADGTVEPFQGDTDIFITPGYRFKAADMLLTNFHLPKSTLFMLVSAFAGLDVMKKAYAHAIEQKYRFYSYGDASLLHLNATQ